jgi:hypothetical protein
MNERTESPVPNEFEYVFAGASNQTQVSTTCSTTDKCDTECVGGGANTSAMNATMPAA